MCYLPLRDAFVALRSAGRAGTRLRASPLGEPRGAWVPQPPMADAYLAVLDDVLADRKVDPKEADSLVELATELGLDRGTVKDLHHRYLQSLARAAWEDGLVEEHEREDLEDVALLLGLSAHDVDEALDAARGFAGSSSTPAGSIELAPDDRVCFTGEMSRPRADLQAMAMAAGLVVTSSVSRKTTVLVCADADSMSGKARKAREVGTTVISEPKFHQLLSRMSRQATIVNRQSGEW